MRIRTYWLEQQNLLNCNSKMKVFMLGTVALSVVLQLTFVTICGANEVQPPVEPIQPTDIPIQPTDKPTTVAPPVPPNSTTTVTPTPPPTTSTPKSTTPTTVKPTPPGPTPPTPPTTPSTPPPSPTTPSTPAPTPTTTAKPTAAPTPRPEPDRKFDAPSFIGGMILTMGLMAIGFVSWKFYKARTERNYHTL